MRSTTTSPPHQPSLQLYMSMFATQAMPQFASCSSRETLEAIRDAGFHGVQFNGARDGEIESARSLGLGVAESGRINTPGECDTAAASFASRGCECATIHLGWGFEDDGEGCRLIEALLNASAKHELPLYPETHRATLFQDMWRTLQFVSKFPELRFNADYSHWYTGSEMVYGDVGWKLDRLAPLFERVRFMHGRIGDPGCIQVPVLSKDDDRSFVRHFREMWTRTFRGFFHTAEPGVRFCFSPEVLQPQIFYARTVKNAAGEEVEVSDRWQQSLLLNEIAGECFTVAQKQ